VIELDKTPIAFIGGGVMAEAFIRGLLDKQLTPAERVLVSEPLAARRTYLQEKLGIGVTDSNVQAAQYGRVLVLAVKPQVLGHVLSELASQLAPETLVLSIIAGARLATLRDALPCSALVRIMPNTPAQVGEGMSVWTATPETTAEQTAAARQMLSALGEELYVDNEDYVDMATALHGSGPAYVLLFIEALIDAGVQMGLARPIAEKLALQTVRGTAIYAQAMAQHPAILRNMVTSPGGTTAEALYVLERGSWRAILIEAVQAAYRKAKQLGEPKSG
jgi:pyrroline-5-carboxylate reductase